MGNQQQSYCCCFDNEDNIYDTSLKRRLSTFRTSMKSTKSVTVKLNPEGMCLFEFLKKKHKTCTSEKNDFYSKWSKTMDYKNWKIISLIG